MKKSSQIRLYNIIFPLWLIVLLSPVVWMIMLAGNFAIDSLVILLAARSLSKKKKIDLPPISVWKKSILRVVLFGFLADLCGALVATLLEVLLSSLPFLQSVPYWILSPYAYPGILIYAIPAIAISCFVIYRLNRRYSFRKCGLSKDSVHFLALCLAIFTAPVFMLSPIW